MFLCDLRRSIDAGVGRGTGYGLVGCVGVSLVVDGDLGEQCLVEDAPFDWLALL